MDQTDQQVTNWPGCLTQNSIAFKRRKENPDTQAKHSQFLVFNKKLLSIKIAEKYKP